MTREGQGYARVPDTPVNSDLPFPGGLRQDGKVYLQTMLTIFFGTTMTLTMVFPSM